MMTLFSKENIFFEHTFWKNVNCPSHCHFSFETVIVLSGEFIVENENKTYHLTKNDMFFIMPYEIHRFETKKESEVLVLEILPTLFVEYESILKNKTPKCPFLNLQSTEIDFIKEHLGNAEKHILVEAHLVFYFILSILLSKTEFIESKKPDELFKKVLLFVDEHFEESLNLKYVAKQLHVNPTYLSRVFSKNSGVRFDGFVNSIRLNKAMILLKTTPLSISEIAFSCGFGSLRNFNRLFKNLLSCTPKEFRTESRTTGKWENFF